MRQRQQNLSNSSVRQYVSAPSHFSRLSVFLRISIVSSWALMVPIAGHTDCTQSVMEEVGYGGSMDAEKRMSETRWPGNRIYFQSLDGSAPAVVWKSWGDSTPFHIAWKPRRTQLVIFLMPLNWH